MVLARDGGVIELHGGTETNNGLIHVADGGELFLTSNQGVTITGDGTIRIDEGGAGHLRPNL